MCGGRGGEGGDRVSIPEHFLLELPTLLGFQTQIGGWTGQQPANTNGFTGLVAVTVITGIDPLNGLLDFLQQLAFTVAGPQLQGMLFFEGRTVCGIGDP